MSRSLVITFENKKKIVTWLEIACERSHKITLTDAWYATLGRFLPICPLSALSDHLDIRWGTGVWKEHIAEDDDDNWGKSV